MVDARHKAQTIVEGIHAAVSFEYSSAAARLADGPFEAFDKNKLALQTDTNELYILLDETVPTWGQVTGLVTPSSGIDVDARKASAGTISAGQVVYVVGWDSGNSALLVEQAQANSPSTMPAIGVATESVTSSANASIRIIGILEGIIDTSGYSINDRLYVSTSVIGGLQNTVPTGSDLVQPIAVVGSVSNPGDIFMGISSVRWVATNTPAELADSSGSLGTVNAAAKEDHVHAHGNRGGGSLHDTATTSVAGFMSGADKTKLDGIATGAAGLTSTAPVNVTKSVAVVGVGTTAARHDHKHDIATAAPGATGVATAAAEGSSTSLARADHIHQSNTAPVNVTKAAAVIGTSGEPARADHKHDVTTAAPSGTAVQIGNSASEGSATSLARSDHTHTVTGGTPVAVGSANAAGSAATFARSDHVHSRNPAGSSGNLQYNNGSGDLGASSGLSYDSGSSQLTVPGVTVTEDAIFSGVISPAQITSDQNNYAPAGFATSFAIRLSTNASRNVTGLAGGAAGRYIVIHNVGSNPLVLVNSSGSSTAANQFLFNADITLQANQSIALRYDGTSSRWRTASGSGSGSSSTPFRKIYASTDLLTPFSSNWVVNAFAPVSANTINAALFVRRFDDTTEEGVGFGFTLPTGVTNLTLYFKSRAQSTPGGTVGVVPVLYRRTIGDNTTPGSWSAGTALTTLSFPTNTNFQYDSQTLTLASLGLTAGTYVQFELTRTGTAGADTLAGDWVLLELIAELS